MAEYDVVRWRKMFELIPFVPPEGWWPVAPVLYGHWYWYLIVRGRNG